VIAWTVLGAFTVWKNRQMVRWRKRRYPMKKIVIISEQGRVNHELIALLTALFPEGDISIAVADKQDFQPCPMDSISMTTRSDETET
jgi:hypothetical protein